MKKLQKLKYFSTLLIPLVVSLPLPILAASCGDAEIKHYKLLPTYTGEADQLIALGIKPDYYPLQLDEKAPFKYLTDAASYMPVQSEEFKQAFTNKLRTLIPNDTGMSWWNQLALNDGERGSDPEYWTHIQGDLTLYENYLLDDGLKKINGATAPKHVDSPYTFIRTNFRTSRDPFTRMPEKFMAALMDVDAYHALDVSDQAVVNAMLDVARKIEGQALTGTAVDGKGIPAGIPVNEIEDENESWLYNDYAFARNWHLRFMDSAQFQQSSFSAWVLNKAHGDWIFARDAAAEQNIANLFLNSTYRDNELRLKEAALSQFGLSLPHSTRHHPIYDQQVKVGGAPMFEGAVRDNMLYLYDLAAKLSNAANHTNGSENDNGYLFLQNAFANDSRWPLMGEALNRANAIAHDLRIRMEAIKKIVDSLHNPVFGVVTLAPGGGVSTIQTNSKYSFIYHDLGFTQPIPNDLSEQVVNRQYASENSFFNMDDNGWWWNISLAGGGISHERISKFAHFDLGVLTANDSQFLDLSNTEVDLLKSLWADDLPSIGRVKVDYNLWNEGIKTPFVMHMVLDQILDLLQKKYALDKTSADWQAAVAWGDYFARDFIA